MTWQPTVGTLSDEQLAGTWQALGVGYYLDDPAQTRRTKDLINEHIDALTAQLERARGIAVALEQEVAERDAMSLLVELGQRCAAGVWLTVNEHYANRETVASYLEHASMDADDLVGAWPPEDQLVVLQWYPDTTVGSIALFGSDARALLERALEITVPDA